MRIAGQRLSVGSLRQTHSRTRHWCRNLCLGGWSLLQATLFQLIVLVERHVHTDVLQLEGTSDNRAEMTVAVAAGCGVARIFSDCASSLSTMEQVALRLLS